MSARGAGGLAAAAVLTAAAAVLTAGCSSAVRQDGPSAAPGTAPAQPAPAERQARDLGGKENEAREAEKRKGREKEESGAGSAAAVPKIPRARLTPATGSFTRKQKEYLVNRVPRGNDPAAVLEAGQEACDRLTTTVKADRKAAVSALRSGEIAHAEAAVKHLCPEHQDLLKAAGKATGKAAGKATERSGE